MESNRVFDSGLELLDTATITSTTASTGKALWPGKLDQGVVRFIIDAADFTTGDETYDFNVQVSADNSTWKTIARSPQVDATLGAALIALDALPASFELAFTKRQLKASGVNPDTLKYIRLNTVLAGTTPSLTYQAYLCKLP